MPFKKGQSGNKAGRPKGAKNLSTLTKEMGRQVLRDMVLAELKPMTDAQIASAKGIKGLVYRDKNGKFVPAKADELADLYAQGKVIEVWEEKPNVQAFKALTDQALDKPMEQVSADVGFKDPLVIKWKGEK